MKRLNYAGHASPRDEVREACMSLDDWVHQHLGVWEKLTCGVSRIAELLVVSLVVNSKFDEILLLVKQGRGGYLVTPDNRFRGPCNEFP